MLSGTLHIPIPHLSTATMIESNFVCVQQLCHKLAKQLRISLTTFFRFFQPEIFGGEMIVIQVTYHTFCLIFITTFCILLLPCCAERVTLALSLPGIDQSQTRQGIMRPITDKIWSHVRRQDSCLSQTTRILEQTARTLVQRNVR